jgi:hypothetical protein
MTATSQLSKNLQGEAGNDNLSTFYRNGAMNGVMKIGAVGGDDNDNVSADIEMNAFSNLGQLIAGSVGGAGADDLSLIIHKQVPSNTTSVIAGINGGTGNDTAHFTSGVTVVDAETLDPVP